MASANPHETYGLHLQVDYFELFEFRVESHLGSGRSGDVYLACSERHEGITRAVKKASTKAEDLLVRGVSLQELKQKFYREVEILQSINFPCILRGVNLIVCPDYLAITMDYCERGPLSEGLSRVDNAKTYIISLYLIRALDYLHYHRIAHGDIKPSKILFAGFRENIRPVLAGFSAAFRLPQNSNMVRAYGQTPCYVAPEARRKSESVDALKCESFAMGTVMLCMALRTAPPPETDSYADVIKGLPGLCDGMRALMHGMVQDDPANRISISEANKLISCIDVEECRAAQVPINTANNEAVGRCHYTIPQAFFHIMCLD
ncbi:hypothetical protein EGW08_002681 [Elysia chlorotica]|uniref:Protein kinase domain-containing protein n=1 Tax=Elysia chlorotica TaxID=188477 RepID=A0A433U6X2_ELYCH|nr:hypothetical protein EGW08_002681 [Elysia chlorotica]